MKEKVITVDLKKSKIIRANSQWRYNYGQKLKFTGVELPPTYQVHFSNSVEGEAKTQIGDPTGVLIPPEYFIPGSEIHAWIYLQDEESGVTGWEIIIPILKKALPTDQEPDQHETTVIDEAINALNNALETVDDKIDDALQEAKDSGAFDGPKGDKGDPFTYEDFTPEQLESLKGPKGNPFTYEDFTPEQLESLRGPKGDPFTYNDFTPEQLEELQGPEGSTIWTTTHSYSKPVVDGHYYFANSHLTGPATASKKIGDLVVMSNSTDGEYKCFSIRNFLYDGVLIDTKFVCNMQGPAGNDGVSPTVRTEVITGGTRVIITDKDGDHVFDVLDGQDGGGDDEVFFAIYGLTTSAEIDEAYQNGKAVFCIDGQVILPLTAWVDPITHIFSGCCENILWIIKCDSDTWSYTFDTVYTKPSGGIPKTDLAPEVQTSLGKADTALQSVPSTYRTAAAQDVIDDAQDAAISAKYTKPSGGIPASDLASGVIPTVPTKTSDLTNDSGFVNAAGAAAAAPIQSVNGKTGAVVINASDVGAGTYSKPSGGIPASDLASAVQTSLGKADSALQSVPSTYRTAAAQDVIDDAQDAAISGKLSTTGNAYRAASIPMGELDSTSTATVMTAQVDGITELRDGVCVWLRNGVVTSASGFTLNINSLGAKPCYSSLAAASRSTTIFNVNYTMLMVYNSTRVDGGCWDIVYGVDTNTTYTPPKLGFGYGTCSTAAATAAKTASISSYALTAGGIVAIKFAEDVPAGATLNITSKGAKAIYYKGAAITAGVIKAGDTVTMIYSTYYHVLSIDRDVDTLPPSPSNDNPLMDGAASPGSSADYARANHVHPSDSSKIGYEDSAEMVTMTASGSTVTCFKNFAQIYLLFSTQQKTYFILAASQTDYQIFTIDRADGANQTLYLSSIVGGVLSQIVLTPGGSSTMTGTLSTIDLNLQNASGVSF